MGETSSQSAANSFAAPSRTAAVRVVGVLVLATVLYVALPLRGDRAWAGGVIGAVAIVAVVPFTVGRLRAVRGAEHPMLAAGEAIVLLLTMVVYGFAAVYYGLDQRTGQFEGLATRIDAVYFTVTTLSTVGFGDIHATGQAARLVVTVQVLFDLTLLAVAIRVLANAAQQRRAEGAGARLR